MRRNTTPIDFLVRLPKGKQNDNVSPLALSLSLSFLLPFNGTIPAAPFRAMLNYTINGDNGVVDNSIFWVTLPYNAFVLVFDDKRNFHV